MIILNIEVHYFVRIKIECLSNMITKNNITQDLRLHSVEWQILMIMCLCYKILVYPKMYCLSKIYTCDLWQIECNRFFVNNLAICFKQGPQAPMRSMYFQQQIYARSLLVPPIERVPWSWRTNWATLNHQRTPQ